MIGNFRRRLLWKLEQIDQVRKLEDIFFHFGSVIVNAFLRLSFFPFAPPPRAAVIALRSFICIIGEDVGKLLNQAG